MSGSAPIVVLALLVVACGAPDAPAPPPAARRLDVLERIYDAGKVDRGVTVRHEFVVKNGGTTPLAIDAKPG